MTTPANYWLSKDERGLWTTVALDSMEIFRPVVRAEVDEARDFALPVGQIAGQHRRGFEKVCQFSLDPSALRESRI